MTGPHPKSPGWYPDPDILPGSRSVVRYWNGRHWTDRRRPALILTTLELQGPFGVPVPRALEGPVRTADLPAPAAEISATRDAPAGLGGPIGRPGGAEGRGMELSTTSSGGGRGTPPHPPGTGGGGGGNGEGSAGSESGKRLWRKWWFFAAAAVIAALATIFLGLALRPSSPGPRVLTDNHFVQLANDRCAKTLPNLRPPDGGPMGSAVSPTLVAGQIDQAAQGLDDLANQLAAIPAAPADQPHIAGWLDQWHQYDAIGHQYAAYLRAHAATGKAPAVLKTGVGLARSIDNFARANGLGGCEFSFTYNPDPSQF